MKEFEPKACKKAQLHKVFYKEPTKTLRQLINQIMAEKRGLSIDKVKHIKSVRKNEVEQLMEELGYAD